MTSPSDETSIQTLETKLSQDVRDALTIALDNAISAVSEECWCAGWMSGAEEDVPRLARQVVLTGKPEPYGQGMIDVATAKRLCAMADALGHWACGEEPYSPAVDAHRSSAPPPAQEAQEAAEHHRRWPDCPRCVSPWMEQCEDARNETLSYAATAKRMGDGWHALDVAVEKFLTDAAYTAPWDAAKFGALLVRLNGALCDSRGIPVRAALSSPSSVAAEETQQAERIIGKIDNITAIAGAVVQAKAKCSLCGHDGKHRVSRSYPCVMCPDCPTAKDVRDAPPAAEETGKETE